MNNHYTLLDLLPYKKDILLSEKFLVKRLIVLSQYLLDEITATIHDISVTQNTYSFDPHVGENLCQIRAVQLLDFLTKDKTRYAPELALVQAKVTRCLSTLKKVELNNIESHETLSDLFKALGLIFPIGKHLYTLILMRFLTNFRVCNNLDNMIIDYDEMTTRLGLSKNLCRRFIHHYQKQLSALSCEFVLDISLDISSSMTNLLRLVIHQDEDARTTLPSYLVMKVLMHNLIKQKTNILIVIKHLTAHKFTNLLYQYDSSTQCYQRLSNPDTKTLNSHCLVIHGVTQTQLDLSTDFLHQFDEIGMLNIIMGNMATHPQYSGKKLIGLKSNPFLPLNICCDPDITSYASLLEEEFLQMKALGTQYGCTENNPDLFFIRHIFVDTSKNQLTYTHNNKFYSDQLLEHFGAVA